MKPPNTTISSHSFNGKRYINARNIVDFLNDDLLYILSNPSEDMFASEYIKERIQMWTDNIDMWEKQDKEDEENGK